MKSSIGVFTTVFNDVFFAFVCGACGCGTAVVIERKSRRMELAMYVSGRWWVDGDIAITAVSSAVYMQAYVNDPDTYMRRSYQRALDRVFAKYRLNTPLDTPLEDDASGGDATTANSVV